jgi:hypothetical protein
MTVTNQLANLVISHTYRNAPFTSPSSIDVGLLDPDGNELAKLGYARVSGADFVGEPIDGVATTSRDVVFPTAGEEWQVAYVALFDEAGTLFQYGPITSFAQSKEPFILEVGKVLRIPAGALFLSFGETVPHVLLVGQNGELGSNHFLAFPTVADFPEAGLENKLYLSENDSLLHRFVTVQGVGEYVRVSSPPAPAYHTMKVVLDTEGLTSIDLDHIIVPKSITVAVSRAMVHIDEDFEITEVGGVSRLTWIGSLQAGGDEEVEVGDSVFITYAYLD